MSTYVLVHGAWEGAWIWHEVLPRLRGAGHDAVAFDLPAHGTDCTPVGDVTLDAYVDRVVDAVDASTEPVYLVGHSMAGAVITQVAERRPDEVATLVYLAAFLPEDGQSVADLAHLDGTSLVTRERVVDEAAGVMDMDEEAAREAFYGECSEAHVALCRSLYRPEPLAPLDTPVETTEERYGSVPRAYVRCARDRAITPDFQREMHAGLPPESIYSVDADHAAHLSAPDEVVEALLDLTGE